MAVGAVVRVAAVVCHVAVVAVETCAHAVHDDGAVDELADGAESVDGLVLVFFFSFAAAV